MYNPNIAPDIIAMLDKLTLNDQEEVMKEVLTWYGAETCPNDFEEFLRELNLLGESE